MYVKFTQEMHQFITFQTTLAAFKVDKMTCCTSETSIMNAHKGVGGWARDYTSKW